MALSIGQIEVVLRAKAGNITEAAAALDITCQGLHKRIKSSAVLQHVLQDARAELVDTAESELFKAVKAGNMTAIIWTLKASPAAKERGWGERHEMTGAGGGALEYKEMGDATERIMGRLDSLAARIGAQGDTETSSADREGETGA